jgi:hypothetical protein
MSQFKHHIKAMTDRVKLAMTLATGVYMAGLLPAHAASTDTLIEGAKLCTRQLPRYEREYGIPTHLLSAIASTESGRYHKGLKIKVPWPWTINADGAGYYFDSKAEAIAKVRQLQAKGIKSIDVGCMQVNLMHHPDAFASINEAFDPEHNVAYAASFVRSIYQAERSWKKAAAYYHSRTPSRGGEYVGHVYKSWYTIVDKLRMAQVNVPKSSLVAMNDMKSSTSLHSSAKADAPYGARSSNISSVQNIKVARLPEQRGHKVKAYHSPRMNSIEVTTVEDSRRDNGVIVVTPDIKVVDHEGTTTASNIPVNQASGEAPRVIRVAQATEPVSTIAYTADTPSAPSMDSAGAANVKVRHGGPTFIFNN